MGTKENPEIINAYQACNILEIPLSTLYYLSKTGRIKSTKIGRRWRYFREDIEFYKLYGTPAHSRIASPIYGPALEKRAHPRINCYLASSIEISIPGRKQLTISGMILNLSAGGVFIEKDNTCSLFSQIKSDDPVNLKFGLTGEPAQQEILKVTGRVLRVKDKGVAVKFRNIGSQTKEKITEYIG